MIGHVNTRLSCRRHTSDSDPHLPPAVGTAWAGLGQRVWGALLMALDPRALRVIRARDVGDRS